MNRANIVAAKKPRATRSRTETVMITSEVVSSWRVPPFQRPLRVNDKVREVSEEIRTDGVIPGVLTVGILSGTHYRLDGQHRIEGFLMSGRAEVFADVRFQEFDTMADMSEEFVRLNSHLVSMRPDDILRGLEESTEALRMIRKSCHFVGYDSVRRGASSPTISMSVVLRVWEGSAAEAPVSTGRNAARLAGDMTHESAAQCCVFLRMAHEAWGWDEGSKRMWGALNMSLCMWLWRRMVLDTDRSKRRYAVIKTEQFKRCLFSLAANADYNDWLLGRIISDRDRPPAYARIRAIFIRRLLEDKAIKDNKAVMPSPPWAKA